MTVQEKYAQLNQLHDNMYKMRYAVFKIIFKSMFVKVAEA